MHIWLWPYAPNNVVQHTTKNTKHQAVGVKKRGSEITVIAMHIANNMIKSQEVHIFTPDKSVAESVCGAGPKHQGSFNTIIFRVGGLEDPQTMRGYDTLPPILSVWAVLA
jgi:hypothetical protein